jgi:hypothetical protein
MVKLLIERCKMISEIDLKDWDREVREARLLLSQTRDLSGGEMHALARFVALADKIVKGNKAQVCALFKPKEGG